MVAAKNGHAEAYEKWFRRYEVERKKKHLSQGRTVPGFPKPPPGPDEVRRVLWDSINPIGDRRAAELCSVHRTTVARWLDGSVQIPPSAYSLLLFHAEGIPPGCGDAWRGFSWESDAVVCPDGKTRLSAREIAGTDYQRAHISALEAKIADLEKKLVQATRAADFGCANDSFSNPQDPRSKAFIR